MKATTEARKQEIDQNFDWFQYMLPNLLREHSGKIALLRYKKIEGIYPTATDAIQAGKKQWPDMLFSIQTIEEQSLHFIRSPYAIT